jgi:hypothetical protein
MSIQTNAEMPWFQLGEYPVRQVIIPGIDQSTARLFNPLFKELYERWDIIHFLRERKEQSDLEVLMMTTLPLVTTCWNVDRLVRVMPRYVESRGWSVREVRVYNLVERAFPTIPIGPLVKEAPGAS